MLWHARGLEIPACPAKLADSGGRRPSKAMAASMSSWRRSSNRSRKTQASNGREMIDDFRLRGSLKWRRRGVPLSGEGGDIEG